MVRSCSVKSQPQGPQRPSVEHRNDEATTPYSDCTRQHMAPHTRPVPAGTGSDRLHSATAQGRLSSSSRSRATTVGASWQARRTGTHPCSFRAWSLVFVFSIVGHDRRCKLAQERSSHPHAAIARGQLSSSSHSGTTPVSASQQERTPATSAYSFRAKSTGFLVSVEGHNRRCNLAEKGAAHPIQQLHRVPCVASSTPHHDRGQPTRTI